ncbi:iron-containing alcohol dehydrogenase, partial [Rhizobium ruizarguesonis]
IQRQRILFPNLDRIVDEQAPLVFYRIPHGLSNALMLGPVLRYNEQAAAPLYAELADVLGVKGSGDTAASSEDFVTHMQVL